jgi:hypothetical protein
LARRLKWFKVNGCGNSWLISNLIIIVNIISLIPLSAQPSHINSIDTISKVKAIDTGRYRQKDAMDVITKVIKIKNKETPDSEYMKPGRILTSIFPAIGYSLSN